MVCERNKIGSLPYNLRISMGGKDCIVILMNVRKTPFNRFRYWMLCKFIPFKIEEWTKLSFGERRLE